MAVPEEAVPEEADPEKAADDGEAEETVVPEIAAQQSQGQLFADDCQQIQQLFLASSEAETYSLDTLEGEGYEVARPHQSRAVWPLRVVISIDGLVPQ